MPPAERGHQLPQFPTFRKVSSRVALTRGEKYCNRPSVRRRKTDGWSVWDTRIKGRGGYLRLLIVIVDYRPVSLPSPTMGGSDTHLLPHRFRAPLQRHRCFRPWKGAQDEYLGDEGQQKPPLFIQGHGLCLERQRSAARRRMCQWHHLSEEETRRVWRKNTDDKPLHSLTRSDLAWPLLYPHLPHFLNSIPSL